MINVCVATVVFFGLASLVFMTLWFISAALDKFMEIREQTARLKYGMGALKLLRDHREDIEAWCAMRDREEEVKHE